MCTCHPACGDTTPSNDTYIELAKTSRSFICGGGAPCARIYSDEWDTIGCVVPDVVEDQCDAVDATTIAANCQTWTTSFIGVFADVAELPTALDLASGAYSVDHADLPCPIGSRAFGTNLDEGIHPTCSDVNSLNCCFCGDKEWSDTSLYCSRTDYEWFECVEDDDCTGGDICYYNTTADNGYCDP